MIKNVQLFVGHFDLLPGQVTHVLLLAAHASRNEIPDTLLLLYLVLGKAPSYSLDLSPHMCSISQYLLPQPPLPASFPASYPPSLPPCLPRSLLGVGYSVTHQIKFLPYFPIAPNLLFKFISRVCKFLCDLAPAYLSSLTSHRFCLKYHTPDR